MEELPNLFKEALRLTRHLGFTYLWIDSLCIIQDSSSDWSTQVPMMSAVYSNAVCSIAFLFPPGGGFLKPREDPRSISPCIVRKASIAERGVYIVPTSINFHGGSRMSYMSQKTWPLSSRAWTFQEHLLSSRTIFYGQKTIMWECVEKFSDELSGTWLPNMEAYHACPTIRPPTTWKALLASYTVTRTVNDQCQLASNELRPDYVSNWFALIYEYRNRALTVENDRIMAFAGVAEAFQVQHGLTYLAGT
jgi:hypothetical protein